MFSLVRLLEAARPVEPVDGGELEAFIGATVQQLRGRVVKVPDHRTHRYPQAPKLLDPIRQALEESAPIAADEIRVAALRELLFRPERVYPEKDTRGGGSAVTLVGAFHDPNLEDPFVVELRLVFGAELGVGVSYQDAADATDLLESVYARTELSARAVLPGPRKALRLAWLGGSISEDATPPTWRERIEAAAAIRGFSAVIFEQPYRRFDLVRREVHDLSAAVVIVWIPYAGDPTGWTTIPSRDGEDVAIVETAEAAFDTALLDATMQLDEWLAADREGTEQDSADAPQSGETRIYKKEYATPGHDVMVRSNDCGHNAWERARKAPKAEKGITKIESSATIAALEKCMRCTGGGRWRVTFA